MPVADPDVCEALHAVADDVVCLMTPQPLGAVGAWYRDFSPTTDEEVQRLLALSRRPTHAELSRRPRSVMSAETPGTTGQFWSETVLS